MNCRKFEKNLADYISGRLNPAETALMSAHSEACPVCARAEQGERRLSARFALVPEAPAVSDLWPRLAMQLPERKRRFAFPRLWFTAPAFTVAAVAVAFFWLQYQPPATPFRGPGSEVVNAPPETSSPMTKYVTEARNIGVAETDLLWEETRATYQMGLAVASEGSSQ